MYLQLKTTIVVLFCLFCVLLVFYYNKGTGNNKDNDDINNNISGLDHRLQFGNARLQFGNTCLE
jgi:hypothetical protein